MQLYLLAHKCSDRHSLLISDLGVRRLVRIKLLRKYLVSGDRVFVGIRTVPHVVRNGIGIVAMVSTVHSLGTCQANLFTVIDKVLEVRKGIKEPKISS